MPAAAADERRSGGLDVRLRSGEGRAVIAAAVLGSALAYMSDDMLKVALPSVSDDLGVGVSEMQWVVNGYFVTMLSLMLTAGSFGDVRGHRRAGAALVPLYLIMLVGSLQSGRLADKTGARAPTVTGNLVVAAGIWWLSLAGAGSQFLPDIVPGMVLLALGLATLGAPLTSATLSAVGERDQGVAGVTIPPGMSRRMSSHDDPDEYMSGGSERRSLVRQVSTCRFMEETNGWIR